MATRGAEHARAPAFIDPPGYARHRPEQTLLYQIVVQHYVAFLAARAAQGRPLPRYVQEVGPRAGEKVFTLQTVPPVVEGEPENRVAQASGFSLHAGVGAAGGERGKLERLCRYVTRPAVSTERLALTGQGTIRYRLKTPYRDGTTHVVFEPSSLSRFRICLSPTCSASSPFRVRCSE